MKLSTLPIFLGLAVAGTVTGSAQSTQVTKDTLIQTIQTTGETNFDRSETHKQAIIDSLQKVYGPFVIYDGSNPADVKKLEQMEEEAEKQRSEARKNDDAWRDEMLGDDIGKAKKKRIKKRWKEGGPPPLPGNGVRTLNLHEADKYARNRAGYCAYIGMWTANEIVTYRAISGLGPEILGAHGLDLVLAHQNTERYADTIGLEPGEHRRRYETSRDPNTVGISAEGAYNQMIDTYKHRRGKEFPKGTDPSTEFTRGNLDFWASTVATGYISDELIDRYQRNSDPLGLFAQLLGKAQCTKDDVDFFTTSYSLYSQKGFEKLGAMRLENTKK